MKRVLFLGAALLLSLTSCSNPFAPKAEGGTEIVNEHPDEPQNSNPFEPTTDPPAVPLYDENDRIICKIRHYSTESNDKSVLVFTSGGMVWSGTYTQNEGKIGADNILRKSDGTEIKDFTLMDDKWMDSVLSADAEDDFMLFGEMKEICQAEASFRDEMRALAEKVSPDKPYTGEITADSSVTDYYYADVCAKDGDSWVRVPVMVKMGDKQLTTTDPNAYSILKMVMDNFAYEQWMSSVVSSE
ncbi:MAG: hypothetical protein IJ779_03465 [Ruminococcus sp.]|nr:hypothetical protein [Ruminococcus sp.]